MIESQESIGSQSTSYYPIPILQLVLPSIISSVIYYLTSNMFETIISVMLFQIVMIIYIDRITDIYQHSNQLRYKLQQIVDGQLFFAIFFFLPIFGYSNQVIEINYMNQTVLQHEIIQNNRYKMHGLMVILYCILFPICDQCYWNIQIVKLYNMQRTSQYNQQIKENIEYSFETHLINKQIITGYNYKIDIDVCYRLLNVVCQSLTMGLVYYDILGIIVGSWFMGISLLANLVFQMVKGSYGVIAGIYSQAGFNIGNITTLLIIYQNFKQYGHSIKL